MSMIRAQEYFAPLRSRHISLQQWERGLLFETWGSPGRADRQISADLAAPDSEEQEFRTVKKVVARSVSFSASVGRDVGSELKIKSFARGLSFPRSSALNGEIIPEESDYCSARRSNADMFAAQMSTAYIFPRPSLERVESGHIESSEEISDSSCQDSEDSSDVSDRPADLESRPWQRKCFSAGLSFSRDRKFFSGVLSFSKDKKCFSGGLSLPRPCGKSLDRSRSWGVNDISSPDHNSNTGTSSSESNFKNKFLTRILTFSRSLDPRGEISPEYTRTPNRRTEIRRGLSFSRSLDVNGDILSPKDCCESGSFNSGGLSDLSWSSKFISRSGLFFSRTFSPKRSTEGPSPLSSAQRSSAKDPPEVRPKKLFGRGFSLPFSRFLDPISASSSVNSGGINGSGKVDKGSQFKRFFTRGLLFSKPKSVEPVDQSSVGAACDATGSSGNTTKFLSKRFFSKDWSWSRNKNRSTSPAKNSSQIVANPRNSSATDATQSCEANSNRLPSSRHSQALKNWWSKRCQSGVSSKSALSPENSRLVLLENVPAATDKESDDLTVYVGERGGSLTKYVLAKQILRHHLFQVLLKCSQDELGSDHDYTSGVPIICDPALFLQVARVVGGNLSSQTQLCR